MVILFTLVRLGTQPCRGWLRLDPQELRQALIHLISSQGSRLPFYIHFGLMEKVTVSREGTRKPSCFCPKHIQLNTVVDRHNVQVGGVQ